MRPRRSRSKTVEPMEEHFYAEPLTKEPIDQVRYGGKVVAIWRRRVIDADSDFEELSNRLAKKGLEEKVIFMQVPRLGVVYV